MQEGFSLEAVASFPPSSSPPGWKMASPSSTPAARGASWEARQAEEHSHSRHPMSSAHQKPQEGVRRVGIISERRGLSSALLCLSNAAPGDLVAARDFWSINYLIPSSHVVFSPECSSPMNAQACVWGERGWAGGCRAGAGERTLTGKQCRGTGDRSSQLKC